MNSTVLWIVGLAITVGIAVLACILIVVGWQGRAKRQAWVPPLPDPIELSAGSPQFAGKYVAATKAADPYDRIVAQGLAFRGDAVVTVAPEGLLIDRIGERSVTVPAASLLGVSRATWTIDRVVEQDGLQLVRFRIGEAELDVYLRMDDPSGFEAAIAAAFPASAAAESAE